MPTLFAIVFYLLLIDSLGAIVVVWFGWGDNWYYKNLPSFSRFFPLSKGWISYYLIWTLWLGIVLWYFKVLPWPGL